MFVSVVGGQQFTKGSLKSRIINKWSVLVVNMAYMVGVNE